MKFSSIYPLLVNKAVKKGRTGEEVSQVISWLTGYSRDEILKLSQSDIEYAEFFRNAPAMNPARNLIRGTVCGVRVETISESLMREIRILDKLIDELAKGKARGKNPAVISRRFRRNRNPSPIPPPKRRGVIFIVPAKSL